MHLHDTSFRKSAVSMKVRKDRRFTRNGLRNIPNTQKSEKVRWGRVTSADFFCLRHYPSHTFTAKPPLKKYVFVQCPFGGGEGNRTPVRKPIHETFSGRIRLFEFPFHAGKRHSAWSGSFISSCYAAKLRHIHVHCCVTPHPKSQYSSV